ncbi:DNA adenine methylase [Candidatus Sumerlaeota bacterium]|nr:DNA adenine methylase [Candidatus Sumerlaeota bacterium]
MVARKPVQGAPSPPAAASVAQPIEHINRQIPPLAHTPMYVWHKFWGRKTWSVVAEYIKAYCPEGGIVLDPFAGSGVVAMEALKAGRKAIVCDLLPVATEITRLTLKPVDVDQLRHAFERVAKRVKDRILALYETRCRKCRHAFPFTCAVWDKGRCVEIRYESCPNCGDRRERNCLPNRSDLALLREIERMKIKAWYPRNRLYYPDGTPFMKKERYESLDQMFTKRNLVALSWLMAAIEKEPRRALRDFLKIAFTSMVHLCSRMVPAISPTPGSHQTPFSSTWSQHSYWHAPSHMEQNVWDKFESAVAGHQGLLKAKENSNQFFTGIRSGRHVEDVLAGRADVCVHCGDALDLMKRIVERHGPCMDYIFTDPPYDAAVQYGELAYLWTAWLGKDQSYLDRILTKEVIRNERQHKTFDVYHGLLRNAFRLMHDILKPDGYMTVTFHNPTFKVRNATINAGVMAGFDFEKIHHQPLGQVSAKAMLQPFGSAQGDFYLRFHKSAAPVAAPTQPERIDEARFERIVLEATRRVLAERGEPTPYTILLNAIDPELAHNGYFSQLRTGLDVRTVLEKYLDQEFVLRKMQLGGAEGKAWWFRDPSTIPHLATIPLAERVEQTVLRKLQAQSRVTFTDMWKAISEEFPNALTTDSTSIKEALQSYARPVGRGGEWMLKGDYSREKIRRVHTLMIAILAEVGKAIGHEIWIGQREQADSLCEAFPGREGELRQFVSRPSLAGLENAGNIDEVENIDVLWLRGNRVEAVFEVEATTSMTEALKRGSNVEQAVAKYLVIPQDREGDLRRKMRSPLFEEYFRRDSWNPVFCERLQKELTRLKTGDVGIEQLISKMIANPSNRPPRSHEQLDLLGATAGE